MDTPNMASRLVLAVLVLISLGAALFGLHYLSAETLGVGVIGGAVLVAIIARINQAADHQAELLRALERSK